MLKNKLQNIWFAKSIIETLVNIVLKYLYFEINKNYGQQSLDVVETNEYKTTKHIPIHIFFSNWNDVCSRKTDVHVLCFSSIQCKLNMHLIVVQNV